MKKHGTIWQPEDLQVQKNKNQDGSIGYLSEPMLPFLHFAFQQDAMSANDEWRS